MAEEDQVPEKKETLVKIDEIDGECPINYVLEEGKVKNMIIQEGVDRSNLLQSVFGTNEVDLSQEIMNAIDAMPGSKTEQKYNSLTQAMHEIRPKNATEARLCAQAHVLFSNGMKYLERAEDQGMMCHADHYLKYSLKLIRLHNETILALDKLRRGGEQKVTVRHQHICVNDGGKAAFMTANMPAGGGVNKKQEA